MRLNHRILTQAMCAALLLVAGIASLSASATDQPKADQPEIFPLKQVKAGMKGIIYTIFTGDLVEPVEFEVIGVLPNTLGPEQDIILVQLKGEKAEHTGVAAGMSGSPAYIDGKLLGALSLKIGIFNKEAIGGVTPFKNMLEIQDGAAGDGGNSAVAGNHAAGLGNPAVDSNSARVRIPDPIAQRVGLGSGNFLIPIPTPLLFSGFYPQTLAQYSKEFASYGMTAMESGTAEASPEDAKIQRGDMVGMVLADGDASMSAGCTVTAIIGKRVFICGHPLFGLGAISMPMARGHVVTTLASAMESTKIMNTGGVIGTIKQDKVTAVMGELGAGPKMIPLEMTLVTPGGKKQLHFNLMDDRRLTPLLVGITTLNSIIGTPAYSEGSTLRLTGNIEIEGHSPVRFDNMFAPSEIMIPEGFFVANMVQSGFMSIFTNPYEQPHVNKINLQVECLPERRWAVIDGAWSEKSEVHPGETISVKVLLRPYRGAPVIQEVPLTIPVQAARGNLRIQVSDAEALNRMSRFLTAASQGQLTGLEELIQLVNRQRRNDRIYVTLLQPNPTLMVEDKELPNVPLSAINVLDHRRTPGGAMLLGESVAGEWSVDMNQVITGQQYVTITVK